MTVTGEVARKMRDEWRERCAEAAAATPPGMRLVGFLWDYPRLDRRDLGGLYPADPDGPGVGSRRDTVAVYAFE